MADHHSDNQEGLSTPQQCSSLRKNGYVLMGQSRPCKIVDMSTSKTGKHGHAKVNLVGIDIFTEKKHEEICQSTHNMNVPNVIRADFQLVDIDKDGSLTVLDDKGGERTDFKLPCLCDTDANLAAEIKEKFEDGEEIMVTVISAMGTDAVKAYKCVAQK